MSNNILNNCGCKSCQGATDTIPARLVYDKNYTTLGEFGGTQDMINADLRQLWSNLKETIEDMEDTSGSKNFLRKDSGNAVESDFSISYHDNIVFRPLSDGTIGIAQPTIVGGSAANILLGDGSTKKLSDLVTSEEFTSTINKMLTEDDVTTIINTYMNENDYVDSDELSAILNDYVTKTTLNGKNYATKDDLEDYVKQTDIEDMATLSDIDTAVDFTSSVANFDLQAYLEQAKIASLVSAQADNTSKTYKGYDGQVTITKSGTTVTYSGLIRALVSDNKYSYRAINAVNNNGTWTNMYSPIIKENFNPGYYYSNSAELNSKNEPVAPKNPIYIGTTNTKTVSETCKYIWYTNDGESWSIQNYWITDVDSSKIYIATSHEGIYSTSAGKEIHYPGGYVCYYDGNDIVTTSYGKSNWCDVSTVTSTPATGTLATLTEGAVAGKIPYNNTYKYIWAIDSSADKSVGTNWTAVQSSTITVKLDSTQTFNDIGNLSVVSGTRWVNIDSNGTITSFISPTSSEDETSVRGNLANWSDATWRNRFLSIVFTNALKEFDDFYDSNLGYKFRYSGTLGILGNAGYITARNGMVEAPTSDDPTSAGYTPTTTFIQVAGCISGYGYHVEFTFYKIAVGIKDTSKALANQYTAIGGKPYSTRYLKVESIGAYQILFTDMTTGTSTPTVTLISGDDSE